MKVFLDACRMFGPLRLAVEAPGERSSGARVLHQPFALVGRDHRADVLLDHHLVSRRHAYLQVVEGHLFWVDLESRHGVGDGEGRCKCGWLPANEAMRIGPFEVRRLSAAGATRGGEGSGPPPGLTPLVAESYGVDPWPKVAFEFLNGPSRSTVWPVNRVLSLIGSAVGCKLRLTDPSVAPFHCSLVRTPVGVWVVDLWGDGGVMVNGAVVRHSPLADGDLLRVGRYRVRVLSRIGDFPSRSVSPALALPEPPRPSAWPGLPALAAGTTEAVPAELMPQTDVLMMGEEAARISESVLVPLVNQFGMMQQQMLDQFQNAMGMLVEMFGSLQREQMDQIRRELDQLREVTREFQDLKLELAALARDRDRVEPVPSEAVPVEVPAAPTPTPAPTAEPAPSPLESPAAAAERLEEEPSRRPEPSRGAGEADVMLWLSRRITTLQEERESRWRKILKLLPNAS